MSLRLDDAVTHYQWALVVMAVSGHLGQDLIHFGGRESAHGLVTYVPKHVCCQQHAGGRLIVWGLEDAHLVILTERPVHLLDSNSHRLNLGGPGGYALGRLLGVLNALIGKFHQTDVRRLNFLRPPQEQALIWTRPALR